MKRLLAAVLLALLTVVPATAFERWPLAMVNRSVAMLAWQNEDGNCTAFSINQKKGRYLTAGHCVGDQGTVVLINDTEAELLYADYVNDIAVYDVADGKGQPALKLGLAPVIGDEIMYVGHGYGAPVPVAEVGIFLIPSQLPPFEALSPKQFASTDAIPGMSGGPIVNRKGEVVGMVTCSYRQLGCGVEYVTVARVYNLYK
jgi:S1-C subfamily serine protease